MVYLYYICSQIEKTVRSRDKKKIKKLRKERTLKDVVTIFAKQYEQTIALKNTTPYKSAPLSIKKAAKLVSSKRGSRLYEQFCCTVCRESFIEGWRYKTEWGELYLCQSCKQKAKPHSHATIIYTPFESHRNKH